MQLQELKYFLKTLTVAKLKEICNTRRCWGVYQSSPAIAGYSKCKNKAELIEHIYNHYAIFEEVHYCDNECPNYFGYVQKEIDFTYNGLNLDWKTMKLTKLVEAV